MFHLVFTCQITDISCQVRAVESFGVHQGYRSFPLQSCRWTYNQEIICEMPQKRRTLGQLFPDNLRNSQVVVEQDPQSKKWLSRQMMFSASVLCCLCSCSLIIIMYLGSVIEIVIRPLGLWNNINWKYFDNTFKQSQVFGAKLLLLPRVVEKFILAKEKTGFKICTVNPKDLYSCQ